MPRSVIVVLAVLVGLSAFGGLHAAAAPPVGIGAPGHTQTSAAYDGPLVVIPVVDVAEVPEAPAATGSWSVPSNALPSAFSYDYRPDFARPPPVEVASDGDYTPSNSVNPAEVLGWVRRVSSGSAVRTVAPRHAAGAADEVFHYTRREFVDSIQSKGLRSGSYATPSGKLSPLQAHIDLAVPPNTDLRDAVIRIDVAGLRRAGYDIPGVSRVSNVVRGADGRVYTMPGGGYELNFPYVIPPEFLKVMP